MRPPPLSPQNPHAQPRGAVFTRTPCAAGFTPEITPLFFAGHQNGEVAFLHAPSRTLVEADLLFNLPATEQYSRSARSPAVPLLGALFRPTGWLGAWLARLTATNKDEVRRDARVVAGWDFDRVIPCHGVSGRLRLDAMRWLKVFCRMSSRPAARTRGELLFRISSEHTVTYKGLLRVCFCSIT